MSRVEELLHAFTAEFQAAGDADPRPYLRELSGADRAELVALIDHYLTTAPLPAHDPEAFSAFKAHPEHAALVDRVLAEQGLVELRQAAGLTKAQVGARLAEALELPGQTSLVKGAYHDIEAGQVEPKRVRAGIVELLARFYDTTTEQLWRAVGVAFDTRPARSAAAFTRTDDSATGPSPTASAPAAPGDAEVRRAFFVD